MMIRSNRAFMLCSSSSNNGMHGVQSVGHHCPKHAVLWFSYLLVRQAVGNTLSGPRSDACLPGAC